LAINLTIGVDIGGTRTKYGLVNMATGEVLHSVIQPTEKRGAQLFLQQIGGVMGAFRNIAESEGNDLCGIGIGVPGFTNEEGTVITTYGFLPFMENYPLKGLVET
jgi:glucokinase